MDGPSVNRKFCSDFKSELEKSDEGPMSLVDTGSCGLHVLHNSSQSGHTASGWKIRFLRNLFWLFKDCPARRAHCSSITGSKIFPMKFCGIRWLENSNACQRAMDMLPHLKVWVAKMKKLKTRPFEIVKEVLDDELSLAKLEFLKSVALRHFYECFNHHLRFSLFSLNGL